MLKITKTYTDFDDNERTETAYFNMTRTELAEIAIDLPDAKPGSESVDQASVATKIVETMGEKGVFNFVKDILAKAYGERSEDGRRFIKNARISEEFTQTMLFDEIFMELMSNEDKALEFINSLIPKDIVNRTNALPKPNK